MISYYLETSLAHLEHIADAISCPFATAKPDHIDDDANRPDLLLFRMRLQSLEHLMQACAR